jgi:hypothetical protein
MSDHGIVFDVIPEIIDDTDKRPEFLNRGKLGNSTTLLNLVFEKEARLSMTRLTKSISGAPKIHLSGLS